MVLTSQPDNYTADLWLEGLSRLKNDLERAEHLQDILISHSTGGSASNSEYQALRKYFLSKREYESTLPDFVRIKRDLAQFWSFIKHKFSTYAERREFIWSTFSDLLNHLEKGASPISESLSSKKLSNFGANAVHREIQKGLERVKNDPEGAITIARTILESTCKFIADEMKIEYRDKNDLSVIYKAISKELRLSPDQHNEDIFKQILGGCSAVVNGLGTLRNRLGDAHGSGAARTKPSPRHAELAVNLAGSMAIFLVETYEAKKITF